MSIAFKLCQHMLLQNCFTKIDNVALVAIESDQHWHQFVFSHVSLELLFKNRICYMAKYCLQLKAISIGINSGC